MQESIGKWEIRPL